MSAHPSPADPNFPQLEIARNPELMKEVFQKYLHSLGNNTYQVRECRISRVRYHPLRCILEYVLYLKETDTGRERSQLVTGTLDARGKSQQIWKYLQRSAPGQVVPDATSAFARFFYVPDLEMLVQVFPYDRNLPGLPLLMAGLPPELKPALVARFGPGDWQAEAWDVESVKYVAGLRATLRLTVRARNAATGRSEERCFYAKVYKDGEKGEQTYQALRALWDTASSEDEGFALSRPIAYFRDLQILLQEEVLGVTLQDHILLRGDEAMPTVRRAAGALAALHLANVVAPRHHSLRDEVITLEKRGRKLMRANTHLGPEIENIIGVIVARLEEVPPAPTHGDLHLKHIVLHGDRLCLLDLDEFAIADPLRDVARALAHFSILSHDSYLPRERAQVTARAFSEEYFAHVPEVRRTNLPLHYATALLKFATGREQDKVEALLEEAKESLAGRVW